MTKRDLGFDRENICGKLEIMPGFAFYITAINSKHQSSFLFCLKFHRFYMLMQIYYKPVVQACHDFKLLMHTSKGEEINFKFLFIQFRFVR